MIEAPTIILHCASRPELHHPPLRFAAGDRLHPPTPLRQGPLLLGVRTFSVVAGGVLGARRRIAGPGDAA
jgi:hypothetical protein